MPTESDPTPLKPSPELEAAQRISETLFQHLEVDDLVELTLSVALQEVGAEAGSILLVDHELNSSYFTIRLEWGRTTWNGHRLGSGYCGKSLSIKGTGSYSRCQTERTSFRRY